ncbi:carbohydrate deacetylase [Methylobacter psychrophilus]|uniref:carbohydrate deacetylase n=1 Tax=Methylobacter psychrophilus TaxID=96941 RepID=UPI0021D48F5F|nr:ChbG/HpnK family deacetylase [Methylobacter psychrophilus]
MIAREPIHLIINADDYGYYPCISQGILDAVSLGAVTATGIMANSPDLKIQLEWLNSVKDLDLGVHLNLTFRQPLTATMADKLAHWNGYFPNAYLITGMILAGKISIQDVRSEWSAQIEACQGQKLQFLNSHEHIHMLPVLFPLTLELARKYAIPYVRLTQAEWLTPFGISALVRNTLLQAMQAINKPRLNIKTPLFLGLSQSGKLDFNYLETIFSKLKPGKHYELMCHPGRFNASEISDPKLISYHDWDGELALLQSQEIHALYKKFGIRLSHYQ